jgi:hypothetical protein
MPSNYTKHFDHQGTQSRHVGPPCQDWWLRMSCDDRLPTKYVCAYAYPTELESSGTAPYVERLATTLHPASCTELSSFPEFIQSHVI